MQARVRVNLNWTLFPHSKRTENTYRMGRHEMQKPSGTIRFVMRALAQVLVEGLVPLSLTQSIIVDTLTDVHGKHHG